MDLNNKEKVIIKLALENLENRLNKIKETEITKKGYSKDIFSRVDQITCDIRKLKTTNKIQKEDGRIEGEKYVIFALKVLEKDVGNLNRKIKDEILCEGLIFFDQVTIDELNNLIEKFKKIDDMLKGKQKENS